MFTVQSLVWAQGCGWFQRVTHNLRHLFPLIYAGLTEIGRATLQIGNEIGTSDAWLSQNKRRRDLEYNGVSIHTKGRKRRSRKPRFGRNGGG